MRRALAVVLVLMAFGCGDDGEGVVGQASLPVGGENWCDLRARCAFVREGGSVFDWTPQPEVSDAQNNACGCVYWEEIPRLFESPGDMPEGCWHGALPDDHPGCSQPGGVWAVRPE